MVKSFEKEHNHALFSPDEVEIFQMDAGASDAARNPTTGMHMLKLSRSDEMTESTM